MHGYGGMTGLATIARRNRFGHAVLFAVTVCLLVGTAAVDPLLTRSFSTALISFHASQQGVSGSQVSIASGLDKARQPEALRKLMPPPVRAVTGPAVSSQSVVASSADTHDLVRLQATGGQCAHVHLVSGRCPTARNEVMVSAAAVRHGGPSILRLGASLEVVGAYRGVDPNLNPRKHLRLVGIFTAKDSDPFWGGVDVGAYTSTQALSTPQPAAYWLTPASTFAGSPPSEPLPADQDAPAGVSWSGIYGSVTWPVINSRLNPDTLPAANAALVKLQKRHGDDHDIFESLTSIYSTTHEDVRQVGQILPFLLVQLGVVLLILLVQVMTLFTSTRRGEAAVLKMRGNGTGGVLRFGAAEFLPPFVVGIVGGIGLAYGVDELVRRLWLPGHVGIEWLWTPVLIAAGMAVVIGVVWCICWFAMARQPISVLLRARPPRHRGARLSTPAAVLGAVCLVGVVLTATKNVTGAPVQVTPLLLAGVIAIVVGVLLVPAASWLVQRLLARRRTGGALAVAQLGRRSGVVTAITTLIITSALLTLSMSVFARGQDNRAARSASDVGAEAMISVASGVTQLNPLDLAKAVDAVDPHHRDFTPAVQIDSSTPESLATLGVIPADMERIADRTGLRQPVPWNKLRVGQSGGEAVALTQSWTTKAAVGQSVTAPSMAYVDRPFKVVGTAPYIPGVGERTIVVDLDTMLKAGQRTANVSYRVYSATQDPKRIAALDAQLRKIGAVNSTVQTFDQAQDGYAATATAWAMNLSIVVAVLSLLAALTSVVLMAVASRRDREKDLQALHTGGVPRAVLRRATVGEFVLLAIAGTLIGALTAPLAAWLTGRTMLWWSTPPPQPLTRTGFQWPVGMSVAAIVLVLLALVAAVFGVRLARAVSPSRKA